MAATKDMMDARMRQMQADVLLHEQYSSPGTSAVSFTTTTDPNSSVSSFTSGASSTLYVPTDEELEAYCRVLNCPGAVMAHGVFVLTDPDDEFRIRAVSQNAYMYFDAQACELLGTSLLDLFENTADIENAVTVEDLSLVNPLTVGVKNVEGKPSFMVNLILSRVDEGIVIDIEDLDVYENTFALHKRVINAINRMKACDSLEEMCQQVSQDFYDLTGYDRVKMYHFHEDHHGEVITEITNNKIPGGSLLGLHYPATDIPQRARDMMKATHTRLIPDIHKPDSPVRMEKGLSWSSVVMQSSHLRPPHSCHKEYLANMGVAGSLGVALVVKDTLWGMMIGHHMTGKTCSYQMRMAVHYLSQAFSLQLEHILDADAHRRHERSLQLHTQLCDIMYQQGQNPGLRVRGLIKGNPNLMELIPGVTGAAIYVGGHVSSVGDVPDEELLNKIILYVLEFWGFSQSVRTLISTDCLQDWDFDFDKCAAKCAGVVCVPITGEGMLLWFRPEVVSTIKWGGKQDGIYSKNNIMHPRASFEVFADSVKGRCVPWLRAELDAAEGIGSLTSDIINVGDAEDAYTILNRLKNQGIDTKSAKDQAATELIHLIDSVKSPIFGVDLSGVIVQWNIEVQKATGRTRDAVIGRPLWEVAAPAFHQGLRDAIRLVQSDSSEAKQTQIELLNLSSGLSSTKSGLNVTCLSATVKPRYNSAGVCDGALFVCQDTTNSRASSLWQQRLDDQVQLMSRQAQALQPNGMDATEENFSFYPDKEAALIGEGAFGKTYKMKSKMDGQIYAVKMINVARAERNGLPVVHLKREVQMLLKLAHDNIIRYYTCYMAKHSKYFCIVMELASGGTWSGIVDAVTQGKECEEQRVRSLTLQLCHGIKHIHSKKMLHRDMKPDNVLLTQEDDKQVVKVTDFGLACIVSASEDATRAGTLTYASPEKVSGKGYSGKDDMWAVGCMLSELLTGVTIVKRCGVGIFAFNQDLVDAAIAESRAKNKTFGDLVARLLHNDPNERPSAAELIQELTAQAKKTNTIDYQDLAEEYICTICSSLVLDAHTVCSEDHLFCRTCLEKWLENSNSCPQCRKASVHPKPLRLRVISNAVAKLASRVLTPEQMKERQQREKDEEAALHQKVVEADTTPISADSSLSLWRVAHGQTQYGSACTIFLHTGTQAVVEVFHANSWFRFRTAPGAQIQWCNPCGKVGASEFGSPSTVTLLEGGGGDPRRRGGVKLAADSDDFWVSKIKLQRLEIVNQDGDSLRLTHNGGFVWMSHPCTNAAVIWMPGDVDVRTATIEEAMQALTAASV
eukprot:CAMPEP_0206256296 /NCGR_PEP_ID=MMETSP0047_2-20121206/24694_1 /ASSEMBLY_ACC=CAM_ASM_000192 /TAXON_ID=195065 /ORGANISM="Chroomonas mesostigmatica_cf, Strain CCMP1168" /LENGTH=1298 /DNA_ID=CAMNT_0053682731 /DNA_START=78 /DNA_END=3975 /DNA_ORIENTATION=-